MISIKHGVNVIHHFSHLIRADKGRNTQFINGIKMMHALHSVADYSYLASGWNTIPMLFGLICDNKQRCNEMLASFESKCGFERQYVDEKGEQPPENEERQMRSTGWKRRVHRRCWRSVDWKKRLSNLGRGAQTGIEEHPYKQRSPRMGRYGVENEIEACLSSQRRTDGDWGVHSKRRSTENRSRGMDSRK